MKQKIKSLIKEISLTTYKNLFPQGFPSGWDVASDIARILENQPIETIFDVGANRGQLSSYFQRKFPQSQIFSFEPIDQTFKQLEKNTNHLSSINCFKYALGSINESRRIVLSDNSEKNSLVEELQNNDLRNRQEELINVKKMDDFCSEQKIDKIDILKIDTEGFELEVIKGASHLLENRRISFIISEVGFSPTDKRHTFFPTLFDDLYSKGFRIYGFYDLCYWRSHFYKGLIYCNALFVNEKNIENKILG